MAEGENIEKVYGLMIGEFQSHLDQELYDHIVESLQAHCDARHPQVTTISLWSTLAVIIAKMIANEMKDEPRAEALHFYDALLTGFGRSVLTHELEKHDHVSTHRSPDAIQ